MFGARRVFSRLLCLYWQVFGGMSRKVGRWGRRISKPIARLPSPPVYTCSVVTLAYSAVFILEVLKFEEDWGNPICQAIKMGMAVENDSILNSIKGGLVLREYYTIFNKMICELKYGM